MSSTPKATPAGMTAEGSLPPSAVDEGSAGGYYGSTPATFATFSSSSTAPTPKTTAASAAKRRSTILVHQKSPLLLATPPQITRALAYSHPFLLPLNKLAGLLSWTTGSPLESCLLVALFWAAVQYGDVVVRWAGPITVVLGIIVGMYARRFSPLSSSGWVKSMGDSESKKNKTTMNNKSKKTDGTNANGGITLETNDKKATKNAAGSSTSNHKHQHQHKSSEINTGTRHQKTLDEMVETLKVFTTRCNMLLEPLLEMTDFLSTQRTPTSATVRPALMTLLVRIVVVTPVWIMLTLPPLRIITTKRVVLVFGTIVLTWHSRACRCARTTLWRSAMIRRLAGWITGLDFGGSTQAAKNKKISGDSKTKANDNNKKLATAANTFSSQQHTGVRFTFIIYENQRRWVGLGWTNSLFGYERPAWTDEHNNAVPPRDQFELPEVEDGHGRWRWVKGSRWRIDGVGGHVTEGDGDQARNGWIFYDNKWQNGRRGQDGWGRWTRRRKWYRDAELVEVGTGDEDDEENEVEDRQDDQEENGGRDQKQKNERKARKESTDRSRTSTSSLSLQQQQQRPHKSASSTTSSRSTPGPTSSILSLTAVSPAPALCSSTDEAGHGDFYFRDNDTLVTSTSDSISVLSARSASSHRGQGSQKHHQSPSQSYRPAKKSPAISLSGSSTSSYFFHPRNPRHRTPANTKKKGEEEDAPRKSSTSTGGGIFRRMNYDHDRAAAADEAAGVGVLKPDLEMEIQGRRMESERWGVGDEVVLGLD